MLVRCEVVTPQVGALLALAMWPDPARIQATLGKYASDPGLQVWAWAQEGVTLCAAGLRVTGRQAEVLHIGTRPEVRGQGTGRTLLLSLMPELNLSCLDAETDDDSVGFYRRAGFEVQEAQARGGHTRYRCTLSAGPPA